MLGARCTVTADPTLLWPPTLHCPTRVNPNDINSFYYKRPSVSNATRVLFLRLSDGSHSPHQCHPYSVLNVTHLPSTSTQLSPFGIARYSYFFVNGLPEQLTAGGLRPGCNQHITFLCAALFCRASHRPLDGEQLLRLRVFRQLARYASASRAGATRVVGAPVRPAGLHARSADAGGPLAAWGHGVFAAA